MLCRLAEPINRPQAIGWKQARLFSVANQNPTRFCQYGLCHIIKLIGIPLNLAIKCDDCLKIIVLFVTPRSYHAFKAMLELSTIVNNM